MKLCSVTNFNDVIWYTAVYQAPVPGTDTGRPGVEYSAGFGQEETGVATDAGSGKLQVWSNPGVI